jgi:hypothetical protein
MDASQAVVTIHFRPAGALPFLGVPLGELENSCVGLDGLWGRHGASLHERLIATPSPADRVALLEAFLLQRLESHDQYPHRGVRTVLSAIAHGATITADLRYFDQAHFVREFRSFTAMSPTQYLARRSWLPSHVELAAAC